MLEKQDLVMRYQISLMASEAAQAYLMPGALCRLREI